MEKIILASASPRRRELIKLICNNVEVKPRDCDETLPPEIEPQKAVEYLSRLKNDASREVSKNEDIVISADTVVAVDGEILGKPHSKENAREMIEKLSGKVHQVFTGVTISKGEAFLTFSEKTDVEFYPLTKAEIESYISTDEPYDKAGAYGIQGLGSLLIKGIKGDYFNVVGLPVARLKRELEGFLKSVK